MSVMEESEKVPRKLNLKIKLAKHDNFDFADIWPVAWFFFAYRNFLSVRTKHF